MTIKKVTMKDVAALAGVSKSTVSQYLNHRYEYMGSKTKEKIEQAITALNYEPNVVARSLKQKRTFTIGVIVSNIMHRYSTMVIRAIEDYCHENGYHVVVCNSDDDLFKEQTYIHMLIAKQTDGLIMIPTGENLELYQDLVDRKIPVVFLDRKIERVSIPTIVLNNYQGAYKAVAHFANLGHQAIGMITPPLSISTRQERVYGFQDGLRDFGLSKEPIHLYHVPVTDVKTTLQYVFASEFPPTALLVGNDLILMEALSYFKNEGMRLPDDLALITFDDVSFADVYEPALTTIAQPGFAMGKKAAECLISIATAQGDTCDKDVYFHTELKVRESCGSQR
ncbi:LacI family kdg operon repressor [Geomicrobium halophilum]|uniref:LacI family kdg operon repressor n=1 Tax=Geomicrobium halophilum TaxID=549000 RepID=A0A841PMM3_9BACL|nr:substrate-binding domain-containing protein [Geomicrobium halophilum]MBB6449989.1 LacI family kdg operon repressor [Geomicrobium halophilum]